MRETFCEVEFWEVFFVTRKNKGILMVFPRNIHLLTANSLISRRLLVYAKVFNFCPVVDRFNALTTGFVLLRIFWSHLHCRHAPILTSPHRYDVAVYSRIL